MSGKKDNKGGREYDRGRKQRPCKKKIQKKKSVLSVWTRLPK